MKSNYFILFLLLAVDTIQVAYGQLRIVEEVEHELSHKLNEKDINKVLGKM